MISALLFITTATIAVVGILGLIITDIIEERRNEMGNKSMDMGGRIQNDNTYDGQIFNGCSSATKPSELLRSGNPVGKEGGHSNPALSVKEGHNHGGAY